VDTDTTLADWPTHLAEEGDHGELAVDLALSCHGSVDPVHNPVHHQLHAHRPSTKTTKHIDQLAET
jgi:hypothetical protein